MNDDSQCDEHSALAVDVIRLESDSDDRSMQCYSLFIVHAKWFSAGRIPYNSDMSLLPYKFCCRYSLVQNVSLFAESLSTGSQTLMMSITGSNRR